LRICYLFGQLFKRKQTFYFRTQKLTPVSSAEVGAVHLKQVLRQAVIGTKWRDGAPQMGPVCYLREKIAS
jgi:hypothetical protein